MRILFISRYFPDDPRTKVHGVYKRMGMFIEAFKGIAELDMLFYTQSDMHRSRSQIEEIERSFSEFWKADIKLFLCPMAEYADKTSLNKWLSFGGGVFNFQRQKLYAEVGGPKQVRVLEECLGRNPDAIFAHRLPSMCPLLNTKACLPTIFFDLDDIEHIVLMRYVHQVNKLKHKLLYLHLPSLIWGEYKAVKLAGTTFVCSDEDLSYLKKIFHPKEMVKIPNAVTIPEIGSQTPEPNLLFLGSDYEPNVEAANLLIRHIWPDVHREIPESKLIIAGISPQRLNPDIKDIPAFEITGFVEDLDALYKRTCVVTAPMRIGGGTRIKIIEAAAYGKPIVSTKIGAEGIDLSDETEILIRDEPKAFAEACIRLLKDSSLREKIGLAAREKIIMNYDRNNVIQLIRHCISDNIKSRTQ